MRRARNLEQTPGLIDADVADDVRSMHAGVGVGWTAAGCTETAALRLATTVRLKTVGSSRPMVAGHAVAELGGVLDVVHAGDGVVTAEQVDECCCPDNHATASR